MNEDGFCDFGSRMDNNILNHIAGYEARLSQDARNHYGNASSRDDGRRLKVPTGPGYYMEQFAANMEGVAVPTNRLLNPMDNEDSNPSSTMGPNMYDPHYGYGVKTERESPESKDEAESLINTRPAHSSMHMHNSVYPVHYGISKPMPMRSGQDKSMDSRPTLSSPDSTSSNAIVEPILSTSMLGQGNWKFK